MKQTTHSAAYAMHLAQKKRRKKKKLIILIIVLLLLAALVVAFFCFMRFQDNSSKNSAFYADQQTIKELESGKAYTLGQASSASQSSEQGRITNISIASTDLNNCQIA